MFLSTPLNITLRALELPTAYVSSASLQFASAFRLVVPSSAVLIG
jgi:hypothetical protein